MIIWTNCRTWHVFELEPNVAGLVDFRRAFRDWKRFEFTSSSFSSVSSTISFLMYFFISFVEVSSVQMIKVRYNIILFSRIGIFFSLTFSQMRTGRPHGLFREKRGARYSRLPRFKSALQITIISQSNEGRCFLVFGRKIIEMRISHTHNQQGS